MDDLKPFLLRHFEDQGDSGVDDLIYQHGDPRQALLHFRVFHPEFIEVGGRVVLKSMIDNEGDSTTLLRLLEQDPDNAREILAGYRWVEVLYLFLNDDLDDEDDYLLAQLMAKAWRGALMEQFPEQEWVTRVLEPEETGSTVGVSFEEDF